MKKLTNQVAIRNSENNNSFFLIFLNKYHTPTKKRIVRDTLMNVCPSITDCGVLSGSNM